MCTMYIYYCRFGGGPRVQSLETCAVCEVRFTSCNLHWFHRVHVFNAHILLCISNLHTYLYSVYVTQSVLGLNHNVITCSHMYSRIMWLVTSVYYLCICGPKTNLFGVLPVENLLPSVICSLHFEF